MGPTDADQNTNPATVASWRHPFRRTDDPDAGLVLLYVEGHAGLPPVFPVPPAGVTIGRFAPAEIVIPHNSVSRLHARVQAAADGYVVRDLGSRNGVIVQGARVERATLRHDDVVRVGDVLFKFVAQGARDFAAYSLDGQVAAGARPVTIPGAVGGLQLARVSLQVEQAARRDIAVLVMGETGTGKELVAAAVHAASGRRGAFVAVNCAAIPPDLVESELFGWKRGAFSGAQRDHAGYFRAAAGGTLLLDEIGDMPLAAQAKLLRTLETREVQPLGALHAEPVDVRIVAATHRDLRASVEAGTFRGDLFARLNGYPIAVPPLRERKEDLYPLVCHVLREMRAPPAVTFRFMVAACHYDWPYNVRELVSAVRRGVSISEGGPLDVSGLPDSVTAAMDDYGGPAGAAAPGAPARPGRPTASELDALLRTHRGNLAAVGRALGKDRAQVHRWLHQMGIDPDGYR